MPSYRTTIRSGLDTTSTFNYMADFAHSANWDPGVLSAEQVGSEPIGLGTRFALVTSFLSRQIELDYAITTYEPQELVTLTAEGPGFSSIDTVTISPVGDGAAVTYNAVIRPHGALRLATPLLAVAFHRLCGRARNGLVRELNG